MKLGFITYCSRSGSTFLSRVLNEYEDICVAIEGDLPPEILGAKNTRPTAFSSRADLKTTLDNIWSNSKLDSWSIPIEELRASCLSEPLPKDTRELFLRLLTLYRDHHKPEADSVLYKGPPVMPWESRRILTHFPDARIIHVIRDPRGVFNSQKRNNNPYEGRPFSRNPVQTATEWRRAVHHTTNLNDPRILEVRYERLMKNLESTMTEICDFLDIPVKRLTADSDSGFAQKIPAAERMIHSRVGKKPIRKRITLWREQLRQSEIYAVESETNRLLDLKNYERIFPGPQPQPQYMLQYRLWKLQYQVGAFFAKLFRIVRGTLKNPGFYLRKLRARA